MRAVLTRAQIADRTSGERIVGAGARLRCWPQIAAPSGSWIEKLEHFADEIGEPPISLDIY